MLKLFKCSKGNAEEYVWYACYGSNISEERFQVYIDGIGRYINGIYVPSKNGCTDKSGPKEDRKYEFKHSIYFAKSSPTWDDGGVAFLDWKNPGFAYGRIYKITKEQFSQIRCQESRALNWYGWPKNDFDDPIDVVDGLNVYTFTQMKKETFKMPSKKYLKVIEVGLLEIGLTKEEADAYLQSCQENGKVYK